MTVNQGEFSKVLSIVHFGAGLNEPEKAYSISSSYRNILFSKQGFISAIDPIGSVVRVKFDRVDFDFIVPATEFAGVLAKLEGELEVALEGADLTVRSGGRIKAVFHRGVSNEEEHFGMISNVFDGIDNMEWRDLPENFLSRLGFASSISTGDWGMLTGGMICDKELFGMNRKSFYQTEFSNGFGREISFPETVRRLLKVGEGFNRYTFREDKMMFLAGDGVVFGLILPAPDDNEGIFDYVKKGKEIASENKEFVEGESFRMPPVNEMRRILSRAFPLASDSFQSLRKLDIEVISEGLDMTAQSPMGTYRERWKDDDISPHLVGKKVSIPFSIEGVLSQVSDDWEFFISFSTFKQNGVMVLKKEDEKSIFIQMTVAKD
mgnify:CR=1 FL=1